jgi:hypothetical protein
MPAPLDEFRQSGVSAMTNTENSASDFLSVFFFLGLWVVAAYAWQRFNEPSFPNRSNLPRTLEPLRYLFLKPSYKKARLAYVGVSLLLYCVLVWPGPKIVDALGAFGVKDFPQQAWALTVALVIVGLVPNSNLKWLTTVEETLRRLVHSWFLVPDGSARTIAILEDARYDPPQSQLDAVPNLLREALRTDLKLPAHSLRYRWARTTMLMASLRQMGAGAAHPLEIAAFEPFEEDFNSIRKGYRVLEPDVVARLDILANDATEDDLKVSIDDLLKRIYAYISWGVRQQAESEREIDQTLEELGFRIPHISGRRLFDFVFPAVLLVALITILFWVIYDAVGGAIGSPKAISDSIVNAMLAATAGSAMYGSAVFIALNGRGAQIEQKIWRQASPKCFVSIAIKAGLVTWAVITVTTVLSTLPETIKSLAGLWHMVAARPGAEFPGDQEWSSLPIKIVSALPWFLAGATASVLSAFLLGGDVRKTDIHDKSRDAIVLGVGLSIAAAAAQLIQMSLQEHLNHWVDPTLHYVDLTLVGSVGLAGLACGAVIGFIVPQSCRVNVVTPFDLVMARALRNSLRQAETTLGTKAAAEEWMFTPHIDLGEITPAEAIQYKTHATGVGRLLENEALLAREDSRLARGDRPMPVVLEGGRGLN